MKKSNTKFLVGILLIVIALVSFGSTFFIYQKGNKGGGGASEDDTLKVVTSFYPMYIATMNVVDEVDGVQLESLSEPQTGCLHDYTLTTEDMRNLSTADVLIVNGGGIETFIEDVAKSYPDLTIIQACDGIELLQEGDESNAHAWMDVDLYSKQVENIAEGLAQCDENNADKYRDNAKAYVDKLIPISKRIDALSEKTAGANVVIFHEAYDYVADSLGMNVVFVMDLDEERQISAGEQADVLSAIENGDVKIVLADETYGKKMGDVVDAESDATTIYIDPLTRGEYDKNSYIDNMNNNISLIEHALAANN
ncbi:MAG: metal ABC transporter substrate-binding protein [Lachnospiraceae bacterium]|nr:metal ABC transporter substrate-binding protein [Lachnospiraceae bacterium]